MNSECPHSVCTQTHTRARTRTQSLLICTSEVCMVLLCECDPLEPDTEPSADPYGNLSIKTKWDKRHHYKHAQLC